MAYNYQSNICFPRLEEKRDNLNKERIERVPLPVYSKREEFLNSLTHAVGAVFALGALIACVAVSSYARYKAGLITGIVYGLSMLMLYVNSSVYHGLPKSDAKKVMRVVDHCTILIFIVGAYAPLILTGIREQNPRLSVGVFIAVSAAAIVGIVFTAIDVHRFRALSMASYLIIGWCFALIAKWALKVYPTRFTILLFIGGALLTIGAVLYGIGKKNHDYFHAVFHVFILAGSAVHFIAILQYCMVPRV